MASAAARSGLRSLAARARAPAPASRRMSSSAHDDAYETAKWEKITIFGAVSCTLLAPWNLSKGHPHFDEPLPYSFLHIRNKEFPWVKQVKILTGKSPLHLRSGGGSRRRLRQHPQSAILSSALEELVARCYSHQCSARLRRYRDGDEDDMPRYAVAKPWGRREASGIHPLPRSLPRFHLGKKRRLRQKESPFLTSTSTYSSSPRNPLLRAAAGTTRRRCT